MSKSCKKIRTRESRVDEINILFGKLNTKDSCVEISETSQKERKSVNV